MEARGFATTVKWGSLKSACSHIWTTTAPMLADGDRKLKEESHEHIHVVLHVAVIPKTCETCTVW